MKGSNFNQSGQIIIILLLIVVLVLAIGLSVVGRSNTEVTTASKIENSARAFSAAEAGIEHAIANSLSGNSGPIDLTSNNSNFNVTGDIFPSSLVPILEQPNIGGTPDVSNPNQSVSFAQVWFANPSDGSANISPINDGFDFYFGNPLDPLELPNAYPAAEIHIIYKKAGVYGDVKFYFDSARNQRTNSLSDDSHISGPFLGCDNSSPTGIPGITTEFGNNRPFFCQVHVSPLTVPGGFPWSPSDATSYPILARVRILYSSKGQIVAIGPTSPSILSLPAQVYVYSSTGKSGESQRTVKVIKETDVMPYLFDFALFSDSVVTKQ